MDATQMTDILDAILRTLYENIHKDGLLFDKEILRPNKISLTDAESAKIWDVLRATGLAETIVGFGNEGKFEITPLGIQMMTRFGSYKNFLASQQPGASPQVTISLANPAADQAEKPAKAKPKKAASSNKESR